MIFLEHAYLCFLGGKGIQSDAIDQINTQKNKQKGMGPPTKVTPNPYLGVQPGWPGKGDFGVCRRIISTWKAALK